MTPARGPSATAASGRKTYGGAEPSRSRRPDATNGRRRRKRLPLLDSIPMIDDTSDTHERSLDWPDADYSTRANPLAGDLAWAVHHDLRGAAGIEELLNQGNAAWCVEARCAETLHSTTATSEEPVTPISLSPRDVGAGTVHLWPGVITVANCTLDPTGTMWGTRPIALPAGRYLARGAPLRVEHQGSDPMLFVSDSDIEPDTSVSIRVEEIGQDCRFVVRARPDRIARLKFDDVALLSCWATALALLPAHDVFKIAENDGEQATVPGSMIGDLILRRLQAEQPAIDLWDNPSAWDPMRAASTFLPLLAEPPAHEDENG